MMTTPTTDVAPLSEKELQKNLDDAKFDLSPHTDAILTMDRVLSIRAGREHPNDLAALMVQLKKQCGKGETGEETLLLQAITLDKLFQQLTRAALKSKHVSGMAEPLKLALKAQAQCRTTLQAVSDIRHPRQYIGQQNVAEQYNAGGHQQVNRNAHADTTENRPTELSEGTTNELHPNGGAPSGVEGAGEALKAVGALDGATNG